MQKRHAQWAKIVLYTTTVSLALFLAAGLQHSYERRQALKEQQQRLEQIQREQDELYQQQQQEYEQQMALWRAEHERIEQQNTQRMEQWRRNPTVRIRKELPQPQLTQQPVADPSTGEPTGGSDPTAISLPPAPAPAPAPVQAEPQYIIVERVKPQPELAAVPEPPKPPTRVKVTADTIELELAEDTSWKTIAQLLVLLLGLYGGVRIINKYTRAEEEAAA